MAAINKHGYEMTGLEAASAETKSLRGSNDAEYAELFYQTSTGEVWAKYHFSPGQNNWTEYEDPDIVKIGNVVRYATPQKIADLVAETMAILAEVQQM